jgi:hypothetical protein
MCKVFGRREGGWLKPRRRYCGRFIILSGAIRKP